MWWQLSIDPSCPGSNLSKFFQQRFGEQHGAVAVGFEVDAHVESVRCRVQVLHASRSNYDLAL